MTTQAIRKLIETEFERVVIPYVREDDETRARAALRKIIDEYSRPHRVYHSAVHLAGVLVQLRDWESRLTEDEYLTAFISLLLHDYVYEIPAGEKSNETLSGEAAVWFLRVTGLTDVVPIWDVKQAIFATEGYFIHNLVDMVVVWCDIWNLSRSKDIVEANSEKIRQEYMKVYSEEEYTAGRRKFLSTFRSPFRLYPNAPLRLRAQARLLNFRANRNMVRELRSLDTRLERV